MRPTLRSKSPRLIAAVLLLAAGCAHAQTSAPQAATPNGQAAAAPAPAIESVVVTGKAEAKEAPPAKAAQRARPEHCDRHPLERKNRLEDLTVIQRMPSAVERATLYDRQTLEHGCG